MIRLPLIIAACAAFAACQTVQPAQPVPGSAEGTDADASCTSPVVLVILVENFDRESAAPYAEALRETNVVADHGGRYLSVGRPLHVLEGVWPDARAFVLETYPCEAAALQMWRSETYQTRVKPFRQGTGDYTVALFDAAALKDEGDG
ncbi:MAG: DUF1330 domain-containing protein [Pseudomonadota bacterium]